MGQLQLQVMVATSSSYWLVGNLPSTGVRIQDVLNDSHSDYVKLTDVKIHQHMKRECLATLPDMVVPKCKIELVAAISNQHEAPEKRWNNFTIKTTAKVFTIVNEYYIQGELQLPKPSNDSLYTLTHTLGSFFALSQASISGLGTYQLKAPLLFANKKFVNCFHLGEPANVQSAAEKLQPQQPEVSVLEEESLLKLVQNLCKTNSEADLNIVNSSAD